MPANDHISGLSEELYVAYEALEEDCNVSIPFGGKSKYDLLIERGGEILKIQVKRARREGHPLRQQISGLNEYSETDVDFFAGFVDLNEIATSEEPSIDEKRHVFYKSFEEVDGKTTRVNYRQEDKMVNDHNRSEANLPNEHDFRAKIDPQLPNR